MTRFLEVVLAVAVTAAAVLMIAPGRGDLALAAAVVAGAVLVVGTVYVRWAR